MKEKDMEVILPIKQIEDNKMSNGTLDISLGFRIMLPELFTLSEINALEMENRLVALFNLLPDGAIFQKLDYVYTEKYKNDANITNTILKQNILANIESPVTKHYSEIYITFPDKINIKKNKVASALYQEVSVFKNIFENINERRFTEIEELSKNIENGLNSIPGVRVIRMNDYELATGIYQYLNQSYCKYKKADESITKEYIDPISFDKGVMKVGDKFISVLSLVGEGPVLKPAQAPVITQPSAYRENLKFSHSITSKASMVYALGIGLPVNHILCTTIQVFDAQKMNDYLEGIYKQLNVTSLLLPASKGKQTEIRDYQKAVDEKGFRPCNVSVNVILQSNDLNYLSELNGICKNHFLFMNNSTALVENHDTQALFLACCPGNANHNFRTIQTVTPNAVTYLHKETHYYNDPFGMLLQDRWGNPVSVQLFKNKLATNSNKVIFGTSGSGKSVTLNEFINQDYARGSHVVMVDIGRSYERPCSINKGKFFDSADKENMRFNIFLHEKDDRGLWTYKNSDPDETELRLAFMQSFICTQLRVDADKDSYTSISSIFTHSIKEFYSYCHRKDLIPNYNNYYEFFLGDFKETIEREKYDKFIDLDNFRISLAKYAKSGEYEYFLNGNEMIDIVNDRYIDFECESIQKNEILFPLFIMIIIDLFNKKISRLPLNVHKILYIDEALSFLNDKKMGTYIGLAYTQVRKKGAEIAFAAQSVTFLRECPTSVSSMILANTGVVILLDSKQDADLLRSMFKFTDSDIELLKTLEMAKNYREAFIKIGDYSRIYRISLSPFALASFTTDADDTTRLKELFSQSRDWIQTIKQYLENKEKGMYN